MNREIKFRAWLPGIKKMTYAHTIEELMAWNNGKTVEAKTAEWLQFTGLRDKNGVEIYEGDVVHVWGGEFAQGYWEHDTLFSVKFDLESLYRIEESENVEVIGNIYEHTHLLKEATE